MYIVHAYCVGVDVLFTKYNNKLTVNEKVTVNAAQP